MTVTIEPVMPLIGGVVRLGTADLCDPEVIEAVRAGLDERGVLVFPGIHLSDEEQLALTDRLGGRVNFNRAVPGADATTPDVLRITLDRALNSEPDYVLGTFFWHVDGVTIDAPLPKATALSARQISASGGATEFASLYAAYDCLPEDEKREIENLHVIHTIEASVRPVHGVPSQERIERYRNLAPNMMQPLVWTHESGRKSLLVGTHADGVVGMPGAHGRALLARLQQWAAQPAFVYRHNWQVGDLVIWDNHGLMHRVIPYTDERRVMHRTVIAGREKPGHRASEDDVARIYQMV